MGKSLAGRGGFEPPLADPESAVLPLDDLPIVPMYILSLVKDYVNNGGLTMESKKDDRENVYYIPAFYWKNYNAFAKSKMDIEETFKRRNFQAIEFFKDSRNGAVRLISLKKLFHLLFLEDKTIY